jgi:Uma2 family endonuclease
MATVARPNPDVIVLERVPYRVYVLLSNVWENRHLRMAYHDGTLEIVSPHRREHERPSARLRLIVTTVAKHLGLPYEGTDSSTFRRGGPGIYQGKGKEPDESFYIASLGRLPPDREVDIDAGDPPPDLWIEVDNRVSSAGRLPVYAALGVPEVWRYRARKKTLVFLHLIGGSYEPVDASLALPGLTPALVLEALALGDRLVESEWLDRLHEWVARTIPPRQG